MWKKGIFYWLALFCLSATAQNKTYYFSSTGNDANNGLSIATAFKTLSHLNSLDLEPGDQILLEGGKIFTGTIQLDANDIGTTLNPIVISSYGNGWATIHAVDTIAMFGQNAGGLTISRLFFTGDGSSHNGIDFIIDQTSADIDHILIDSVDISGFGKMGFLIGADNTDKGFNHVSVQNSRFHHNGIAGFVSYGASSTYSHTDFNVRYCTFYDNAGVISSTQTTGTGIVVSGVDGGLIEYCEAYNNGANNRATNDGGPVGIWVYDAKNVAIQYCESHHNKAGLLRDGGGFDIDGGSQYCTIQYCYSHDNEGYGFALVEYGSSNEFTGNTIRYNISQNDGRKNNYGAIALYGADASHRVKNSEVYNNTVYVDANNLVNGQPCAVGIESKNFYGVNIRNNIFYVTEGVDLINSTDALSNTEVHLQNNNYFSTANQYDISWGGILYKSFASWKTVASDQEENASLGNPLLENAGSGVTVGPAAGGSFQILFGYHLNQLSPIVDRALRIGNVGSHDFFGNQLLSTGNLDIGAAEAIISNALPLRLLSFTGEVNTNEVQLKWSVSNEEDISRFQVQRSTNGVDFNTIGLIPGNGKDNYRFNEPYTRDAFYRLQSVYPSGRSEISSTLKISKSIQKQPSVFYKKGQGAQLQLYSENQRVLSISVYSSNGALVHKSSHKLYQGYNSFVVEDAIKWEPGVYFIQMNWGNTRVIKLVK